MVADTAKVTINN